MLRPFALVLVILSATPAAPSAELCEGAARQAARETGVPEDLLQAIALAETGRAQGGRLRPWPWAANLEGEGHWFATRAELQNFADQAVAAGRDSVDIGCFQINWRWHGARYARPSDLADPLTGARHAARYLADLRVRFGGWERAAGAYHSRHPARAARYAARVAALRGPFPPAVPPPAQVASAPGALASLVPAAPALRPFLPGLAP